MTLISIATTILFENDKCFSSLTTGLGMVIEVVVISGTTDASDVAAAIAFTTDVDETTAIGDLIDVTIQTILLLIISGDNWKVLAQFFSMEQIKFVFSDDTSTNDLFEVSY